MTSNIMKDLENLVFKTLFHHRYVMASATGMKEWRLRLHRFYFTQKNYKLAFMKKISCALLMSKLRDPGILPALSPCYVTAASLVLTQ